MGKPTRDERDEQTNVWTGVTSPSTHLPDSDARDAILEFTQTRPVEIGVIPNYPFDCRFKRDEWVVVALSTLWMKSSHTGLWA
jgi:hypothetical protein